MTRQDLNRLSGIAPVIVRSGRTQYWVHFRWACPKFLRQSFHEFAECSIPQCDWARKFYRSQRDNNARDPTPTVPAFRLRLGRWKASSSSTMESESGLN